MHVQSTSMLFHRDFETATLAPYLDSLVQFDLPVDVVLEWLL